jgi:hypothetical protein
MFELTRCGGAADVNFSRAACVVLGDGGLSTSASAHTSVNKLFAGYIAPAEVREWSEEVNMHT